MRRPVLSLAALGRYRIAFAVVAIAQLLDIVTFLPAVARVGIGAERNRLMRDLYVSFGPAGPVMLKIVAIGLVGLALWWISTRHPQRLLLPVAIAATVGIVGAWSNVAFGLIG